MSQSEIYAARRLRDAKLIRAARAGDIRAEDKLVRLYEGVCRHVAREFRYPGGDRDDVLQEARIGLMRAVRSFDLTLPYPFSTFAELCVRRHVITGLKAAQRDKHKPLQFSLRVGYNAEGEEISIVDLLPSAFGRDPFLVVVAKERIERLIGALDRLSPTERVSLLGITSLYSYDDITARTGWSFKRIDNAAQRARKKLGSLDLREVA